VFFYCDYKDTTTHNVVNILRPLIKQLALQREDALEDMEDFLREIDGQTQTEWDLKRILSQKSQDDFSALLSKMSCRFKRVMLVIDGLDEIELQRDKTVQVLHNLNTPDNTIKTLFTSRNLPDIKRALEDHEAVSIAAQSDDLKLYVNFEVFNRIKKDELNVDEALRYEIIQWLIHEAAGM